jgi:tetratricopeptide (TPR) repeat protein
MMKRLITTSLFLLAFSIAVNVCGQAKDKHQVFRLSLPNKQWAVEVPLGAFYDFGVKTDSSKVNIAYPIPAWFSGITEVLSDDGREYSFLVTQPTKRERLGYVRLEVRLGRALSKGGPAEFRDYAMKDLDKRKYVNRSSLKTWEHGEIPVARFTLLHTYEGGNIYTGPIPRTESGPRNQAAFFVNDDTWITLTLSASPFDKAEESLFDSLIESISIVDTSSPSTSYDYYQKGRVLFLNKEYLAASLAFQTAFAMEQQQRQLELPVWRDLIARLADAYGVLIQRDKAREVLEYGVHNDPENTTLLMGLTRLYAIEGEVDKTLAAFEKLTVLNRSDGSHRPLPDLNNDPAFTKMLKDENFRKGLKAIKK